MAMEVLLRRTIEGVGDVGEVVRVKNGYARNYLFPKGFAAAVSADAMRGISKDMEVEAKRQAALAEYHATLAKQLADMTLTLEVRAGEDGHLYGSVASRHLIAAFEAQGYTFTERQIRFEPVRELGNYEIPVHLSSEQVVNVNLWVCQDVQDLEAMKAASEAAAAAELAGETLGEDGEVIVADGGDSSAEDAPAEDAAAEATTEAKSEATEEA